MRKGVLVADITLPDGEVLHVASRMYSDGNTLYRGHIQGFEQSRSMSDALAGRTTMSIANVSLHNEHEEYDETLISGSADIKIGASTATVASMDDIILDANVEIVSRSDNTISIAILDGQSRGNTKQQRIFDTSGSGFGTLLPEIWGRAHMFPMITLDGDTGLVYGCVGPLVSISAVYTGDIKQTSGYTTSITGNTATVTFTTKPDGSVFIHAIGLGSKLPGAMLYGLLTRVATVCQGFFISYSGVTVTLDERVDDITETLVGKTIQIIRPSGSGGTRTITAFDSSTRIATLSSAYSTNPTVDDIYSIEVNTAAGGFTSAQVDSTGFDALDVALPYDFGLIASNGVNAITMQDELLSPLLCHMGPRRDGIVQLSRLTPPIAPSVGDITRIIGEIQRVPMPIYWHVEARYRKDNTGGHWRSVSAFDATIKATYPGAKTLTLDVPVQQSDGALEIAHHWLDCFGTPTELVTMKVDHDLSEYDLSDVVKITDDRYQFKDGKYGAIVGMTDILDGYDELIAWVGME